MPSQKQVFSTYVEVIPEHTATNKKYISILHVCGGDPTYKIDPQGSATYSPRMWRWSYILVAFLLRKGVFSTYVEVIPKEEDQKISQCISEHQNLVFSTHVEVILITSLTG